MSIYIGTEISHNFQSYELFYIRRSNNIIPYIFILADYQNIPSQASSHTSPTSNKTKSCNYKRSRMRSRCESAQRENSRSSELEVICERTTT